MLKYQGGKLHSHSDIYLIIEEVEAQLLALICKPFCSGASRACDQILCTKYIAVFCLKAVATVFLHVYLCDCGIEAEGMLVRDILIYACQYLKIFFSAKVLDPCGKQMKVVLQCPLLKCHGLRRKGGKCLRRGSMAHIEAVHILYEFHDLLFRHEIRKPASEGRGEVIFSI